MSAFCVLCFGAVVISNYSIPTLLIQWQSSVQHFVTIAVILAFINFLSLDHYFKNGSTQKKLELN